MNIRAVIFDVYNTLLAVGPPPADAAARWNTLWQTTLNAPPRLSLGQFAAASEKIIEREHAAARARGVSYPEIVWPEVVREVLPELNRLATDGRDEFVFQQMQLHQTVQLMPGAAEVLRVLNHRGVLTGLASNAQAYTLRELDAALAPTGLSRRLFTTELCFFSFEHGFSKPNPQVFRLLTTRLRARGVSPPEILMVGNHLDKDMEPAATQGWQTWRLTLQPATEGNHEGHWNQLLRRLGEVLPQR
jgi:putative hydrolase of the HAD superfamily